MELARYRGTCYQAATGFAWGRRVGEEDGSSTAPYRLPGRSTYIRWCRVSCISAREERTRRGAAMSCRGRREERRQERQDRRRAAKELRKRQVAEGLESSPRGTIGNGTSPWKTVREEQQARQEAVEEQLQAYRSALPTLLKRLGRSATRGIRKRSDTNRRCCCCTGYSCLYSRWPRDEKPTDR